jgi:hypothetical protein
MGSRAIVLSGLTALILMVFGVGVGLAADYQDENRNVCEGNKPFEETTGCPEWGKHVTGFNNAALGDEMMPELTSGNDNVALNFDALTHNTTGSANVAIGVVALDQNTAGSDNIALGKNALKDNTEGINNVALGSSALELNEGSHNIAIGVETLFKNTTGKENVATGGSALTSNTTGTDNVASGVEALSRNTTGSENVASGYQAMFENTGSANVAIGPGAGIKLTTGSNNIDISNDGVAAEEGTTRIGTEGTQTKAFVAGIFPTEVSGCFVQVTKEGQLGCNPKGEGKEGKEGKEGNPGKEGKEGKPGPEGKVGKEGKPGASGASNAAIATFASFENVASGRCLNYTEVGDPGNASCPSKTSGFSAGRLLAGPTPANGATVTGLFVDSNASVSGKDSVLVAVIDNTTGATLLTCTVNSTGKNSCSNNGSSGSVAGGDNIEVKLTATGSSGNYKQWRVRFRY